MKTVSLQLATQLKEAGFPQESYFSWISDDDGHWHVEDSSLFSKEELQEYAFAAPTAEEVLEKIPGKEFAKIWKSPDGHYYIPEEYNFADNLSFTLAEAAGKLYLYLKKEGLL